MNTKLIVVTDLDGTLLDHHSYDWREASTALAAIRSNNIPLVLCSSKTLAEIIPLRDELALSHPFIVENGGAIYMPGQGDDLDDLEKIGFGMNRAEVTSVLNALAESGEVDKSSFTGFSEMSMADVIRATGLDAESAANALQREYTEPVIWQGSEENLQHFIKQTRKVGLDAVQGGRFVHVSAGCDKARALRFLREFYEQKKGHDIKVVALGDSDNDISMLELSDLPVLIRSPVKDFPHIRHDHAYRTSSYGPAGWNEAVMQILKQEESA